MQSTKLAWIVASALLATFAACAPPTTAEPAPLGNQAETPPAQRLDSTDPIPSSDPPPTSLGAASSEPAPAAADAGADAARDASAPKKDVAACIAACEAKFPGGTQKSKMIDQCWADHCGSCQTMKPGAFYTPTNGACQTGVYTWNKDCSQCTADWCCWAWDMCFNDAECKSLNDCSVACNK